MTFEIVFRKTVSTDEVDPINQQSDERVIAWFVGEETQDELWGRGFSAEVSRKP